MQRRIGSFRHGGKWGGLGTIRFALVVGCALAGWSSIGGAAQVSRFDLQRTGDRYSFSISATLDVAAPAVWRVFTDYSRLTRLSPAIRESEVLPSKDRKRARVRTLTRLCALIFCKNVRQIQLIRERTLGDFESDTEPQGSDLAYGHARWRMTPASPGTAVEIQFDMEPAFWIPPLLGPLMIEMALKSETAELMEGIERAAREGAGS